MTHDAKATLAEVRARLEWEAETLPEWPAAMLAAARSKGALAGVAGNPPARQGAEGVRIAADARAQGGGVGDRSRPSATTQAMAVSGHASASQSSEAREATAEAQRLPGRRSGTALEVLESLAALEARVAGCRGCELHQTRRHTVFARGNPAAELVFIGEGPGEQEDQTGQPFVGRAGQLLDKMIEAMGLGPGEVYICNVVKCRPPENRNPTDSEAAACAPYLDEQLGLVAPKILVALGKVAAGRLGLITPGDKAPWRGRLAAYRGIPLLATFHPAFLLRSPNFKKEAWEDLKQVLAFLGRSVPDRKR